MNERRPFIVSLLIASLAHAVLLVFALQQTGSDAAAAPGLALTLSASQAPIAEQTPGSAETRATPTDSSVPTQTPASTEKKQNPRRQSATAPDAGIAGNDSGTATAGIAGAQVAQSNAEPATYKGDTSQYLNEVRRIISNHQNYPEEAARRRLEGRVKVTFVIGSGGSVVDVAIVEGSGSRLLDLATEQMFAGLAFPPLPAGAGQQLALTIPINWELN